MSSIPTNAINDIGPLTFHQLVKDWELLRTAPVNALLVGSPYDTTAALAALRPHLEGPTSVVRAGSFALPPPEYGGSLILADLCHFTTEDQLTLLNWLEINGGRARIISTSPRPMGRMLSDGTFLEALYYRLNTIHIDILAN